MKHIDINLNRVLRGLDNDTVISISTVNNQLIFTTVKDSDVSAQRVYMNAVDEFQARYGYQPHVTLTCNISQSGNLYVDDTSSLSAAQRSLWEAVQQGVNAKKRKMHLKANLITLAIVWVVIVLTTFVLEAKNSDPFTTLDSIEYVEPHEFKPGTYRVSVGDYSRDFNIVSIDKQVWKSSNGVTLLVGRNLEIWKGATLALRTSDYSITPVKKGTTQ